MSAGFPLPLIFTAWGFRKKGDRWHTGEELADWCSYAGIRTVAVQLGYNQDGQENATLDDVEPLRRQGLRVMVWGVADGPFAVSELQRLRATEEDWLPQIEGVGQAELVLDAAARGLRPTAIVTNYSGAGDTAGEAARLREAGVRAVLVECYNDAGPIYPYVDLDRMLSQGEVYGWAPSELYATLGTYHGELPDVYSGLEGVGREIGIYLGEPMSSAQWEAYAELAPAPAPEPTPEPEDEMEPVTDQQGRDAIGFAVQAAAQNWGDNEKPRGRLTVCRRIAQAGNDDTKWNSIRDEIVSLLDGANVPK